MSGHVKTANIVRFRLIVLFLLWFSAFYLLGFGLFLLTINSSSKKYIKSGNIKRSISGYFFIYF